MTICRVSASKDSQEAIAVAPVAICNTRNTQTGFDSCLRLPRVVLQCFVHKGKIRNEWIRFPVGTRSALDWSRLAHNPSTDHMKTITPYPHRSLASGILASIGMLASHASLNAGEPAPTATIESAPPPSRVHALLQVDFSDHYITPRGLNVENEGLIVQPLFLAFWNLYSSDDGFFDSVGLTTGIWSSIHSRESGADPGHWNEFDPIAGFNFAFADRWKLDTTFTAFKSMVDSYPTSTHFEAKLSFDDSGWMKNFSLNPFVAYWQELDEKATVVFDPTTSNSSFYFTVGLNPTLKFDTFKLEFPTFVNLVDDEFYQKFDGSPGGSGAAVFSTGAKASIPLTFMPEGYGFWTFYAGVKYYHLDNQGLLDGNTVLTANEHKKDLVQFHAGISIFF